MNEFFIVKTNRSVLANIPSNRYRDALLETGSVANHSIFFWNYAEVSPFKPSMQNLAVRYERRTHFLFQRLHPRNIMHNLHDDVLPMFHMIKEYVGKGSLERGEPFSLDEHQLLLLDPYEATDSTKPFYYLSNHPLRFRTFFNQPGEPNVVTCFRDAVVGQSKLTTWYQYGFKEPQGPIQGKKVNGLNVREVVEWMVRRVGLPLGHDELYQANKQSQTLPPAKPDNSHFDFPETNLLVIMSRRQNRLILNEEQLAQDLTRAFGFKTVFLRNEDHSFEEQIKILRQARVVLAMHGSILVMAMFCRRGTVVVEMFPYAVPSHHYTPYKTMVGVFDLG